MHPVHGVHSDAIWQYQALSLSRRQQFGTEGKGKIQDMAKTRNPAWIAINSEFLKFFSSCPMTNL